ncbi:MAG: MMPL family transporter [Methylomarinum sp.]|nr:MMPL family transporter [Methylomarinum sp.]
MKKGYLVSGFSKWITANPWWVLLLVIMTASGAGLGLSQLGFKNNYRVYFGEDNPQLKAFDAIQDIYNKSDSVMFVLQPGDGNVFSVATLQAIEQLTEKSWKIPYSSRVDSITNFQHTEAEGDDLLVADLVVDPLLGAQEMERIKQIALHEPFLVNRLVSKQGHVAGVNVTIQMPEDSPVAAMEIAAHARALVAEIEAAYPGMKVYLTGMAMMNNAFSESAMNDNKLLVPLMYGIVILALLLSLKSITATISVVLLIVFSVVSALGLAGWLGWALTPTSAISPTIILTMSVADCVHILVTQLHNMRIGHEKKQAIQESLRVNFQPVFLTSLTTAIGFLSMNFSDAPPFRDLGNIVAMGVMIAWIFSITFLPAMMTILPVKVKAKDDLDNSAMKRLSDWVIYYRKPLLWVNGLVAVVMIAFAPQNQLNDEFVKYFDKSTEFRQGTDFLNNNMGGFYTIEYSIHANGEGAVNEPEFLKQVQTLVDWSLSQSEVLHVNTVTDTFKRLNKNMHGDNQQWYRLPEFRELAAQYLLLYEMSLPYGLDLNDQINIDKSGVRVIVTLESMSSNQMLAIEARIHQWLAVNMTRYKVELASPVLMFSHIGNRNIIRMVIGSIVALILISFLLMIAFKSVKLGLISLIPNLVPAGIAFGVWSLLDGQIGLGLSVVTGMTLGIVVDDTVHFISKYRRARIEKGMNGEDAVRYAFSTVGVALWITSVVLVSGFMVLSFSHFTMNADMGLMTAITIAVALFLDLLFLPPLLMSLDKKGPVNNLEKSRGQPIMPLPVAYQALE